MADRAILFGAAIAVISSTFFSATALSLPNPVSKADVRAQVGRDFSIRDELSRLQDSMESYVNFHGFDFRTYVVTTDDDVLITLFRITQPNITSEDSTPVLLSHGFAASAFDYFANARNESIAFILADNGYDVWAVNYRGQYLSSRTTTSSNPGPEFFYKATWQYMARYDLPAVIDFILEKRNGKKLHIVGQSMGTSAVFALLSTNHSYDEKIIMFHALTPVSSLGEDTSENLKRLFKGSQGLPKLLKNDFEYQLAYGHSILNNKKKFATPLFNNHLCLLSSTYCGDLTGILFDRDQNTDNPHLRKERFPLYFSEYPSGATMANVYLFGSQFGRENWKMMDFDDIKLPGMANEKEYGQSSPPEYDFDSIAVKFSLHYSTNDVFTGVETAKKFGERMKDHLIPGGMHIIDGNRFSHQDALWAWDARCYMYNQVLEDMEGFENNDAYRKKVKDFVASLPYQDGCVGLPP